MAETRNGSELFPVTGNMNNAEYRSSDTGLHMRSGSGLSGEEPSL